MNRWVPVMCAVWVLAVGSGFLAVERYANTPGELADPPSSWPAAVALERTPGRAAVVMLAHPRCPCTRASLHELARLMAQIDGRADGFVLFFDPAGADWEHTDLWSIAEGIPGVEALADPGGEVAGAFGARTSGQVVVYDAAGALLFNGGITSSRGHEGDNAGRQAIVAMLNQGSSPSTSSAVFGCELSDPGAR